MILTSVYIISIMNSYSEGFYLTLPNNQSDLFPGNKPSEYRTKLPQWIHLNGEWEIGLHSIAYAPWNIIRHLDEPIAYTGPGSIGGKGERLKKYYASCQDYIDGINNSLRKSLPNDEIKFDIQNRKVTITLSQGYKVQLRREQAIVLGFMKFEDSTEVKEIKSTETGEYEANLHRETNILVFCDIVQPQIVGNKTQSLLAIVPSEKTTGTNETVYGVENIHYIPVQTKSFQEVGIHLRSSTNESIPFEYERASVTLHLKPLNYFQ